MSLMNEIDVLVLELNGECDLNCKFCHKQGLQKEMDAELVKRVLKENLRSNKQIKSIEFRGGNPLKHTHIKGTIKALHDLNYEVSVLTNGYALKDVLSAIDVKYLHNLTFNVYLDSANPPLNNYLQGVDSFDKTMESFAFLRANNLRFSLWSRMNALNYKEIPQLAELAVNVGALNFTPLEIFPLGRALKDNHLLLNERMKNEVMQAFEKSPNVNVGIHFSSLDGACTYLRKKRLFVNANGKASFCHFLSPLQSTEMFDLNKMSLRDAIEKNNIERDRYMEIKSAELANFKAARCNSAACSYCVKCFSGVGW